MPTEPVNSCVLEMMLPKWVDPVTKSTELVIVCTTIVCAVRVPLTRNESPEDAVAA